MNIEKAELIAINALTWTLQNPEYLSIFITNTEETKNIGLLEDYKELVTLIEWPEKIKKKIKNKIDLFFEYGEDLNKRFLSIKGLKVEKLNVIR